jgi:hypothetical protein
MQMCNAEKLPEVTEHKKKRNMKRKLKNLRTRPPEAVFSLRSATCAAKSQLRSQHSELLHGQNANLTKGLVPRLPATVARSEKWPAKKNDFQPAIVFTESARDVSHLEEDKFVHAKEQVFWRTIERQPATKIDVLRQQRTSVHSRRATGE